MIPQATSHRGLCTPGEEASLSSFVFLSESYYPYAVTSNTTNTPLFTLKFDKIYQGPSMAQTQYEDISDENGTYPLLCSQFAGLTHLQSVF